MPALDLAHFADLFGVAVDQIPQHVRQRIAEKNWEYSVITGDARDAVIIDLLQRIEDRKLTAVENEDKSRWERGWGENLEAFRATGDIAALAPKYIRHGLPLRLDGNFIQPADPNFEANWYAIYREWFTDQYLRGWCNHIFEFGSGSGFNVAYLAERFPGGSIMGLDWSEAAVEICELLRVSHPNVSGRRFDFFHPDETLEVPPNSVFLTVGALEQTGPQWRAFLDFTMRKKPALCVHIEPLYELYNPASSLVDYTACKAHEVRNFWRGFPAKIELLELLGMAQILETKRSNFGSLVLEGYSRLIWRPV